MKMYTYDVLPYQYGSFNCGPQKMALSIYISAHSQVSPLFVLNQAKWCSKLAYIFYAIEKKPWRVLAFCRRKEKEVVVPWTRVIQRRVCWKFINAEQGIKLMQTHIKCPPITRGKLQICHAQTHTNLCGSSSCYSCSYWEPEENMRRNMKLFQADIPTMAGWDKEEATYPSQSVSLIPSKHSFIYSVL